MIKITLSRLLLYWNTFDVKFQKNWKIISFYNLRIVNHPGFDFHHLGYLMLIVRKLTNSLSESVPKINKIKI